MPAALMPLIKSRRLVPVLCVFLAIRSNRFLSLSNCSFSVYSVMGFQPSEPARNVARHIFLSFLAAQLSRVGFAFCRVAARAERCVLGIERGFQARGFTGMPFSPAGRIKLFVQLAVQKYHGRVWTPRAAEEKAAHLGVCGDLQWSKT